MPFKSSRYPAWGVATRTRYVRGLFDAMPVGHELSDTAYPAPEKPWEEHAITPMHVRDSEVVRGQLFDKDMEAPGLENGRVFYRCTFVFHDLVH